MTNQNKRKIKRRWLIPLLIAVLVIFLAYVLFAGYEIYKISKTPEVSEKTREYLLLECAGKPEGYFRDDCYDGVARLYKDPEICEKISGMRGKSNCYREIALMMGNISLCDLIKDYNYGQDLCYEEVAVALKNHTLCEKITHILSFRDDCYAGIAPGLGDPELCEKIRKNSTSIWESCIENVALHNKDPTICDRLGSGLEPDYCIIHLAKEMKNPDICEHIKDEFDRDECFIELSRLLDDKSICNRVTTDYQKRVCKYDIY